MATIHTNNLLGSDTTGTGTDINPYKTIGKALGLAAATGDLIKVAGSAFTRMSATSSITVSTLRSTTFTTSENLVALGLAVGDTVAIDTSSVDGWDREKTLFVISAITTTSISIPNLWPTMTGTFPIYKLGQYHYTSATNTTMDSTITSSLTASSVIISGGWDSTFATQSGWTTARYTGGSANSSSAQLMTWNALRPNIYWDKFLFVNTNWANNSASGSAALGTMSFLYSGAPIPSSNFGVWNLGDNIFNLISNNSSLNDTWNGGGNKPTTLNINQWNTNNGTGRSALKTGYDNSQLSAPTIRTIEAHWRCAQDTAGNASYKIFSTNNSGDIFIENLTLYVCGNALTSLFATFPIQSAYRMLNNLKTIVLDTTAAGICMVNPQDSLMTFTTISTSTGNFENENKFRNYSTNTPSTNWSKSGTSILSIKDVEGYKVLHNDQIIKYADSSTYSVGPNSLRLGMVKSNGSLTFNYTIGTLTKPSGNFNMSFAAKAYKNISSVSVNVAYNNSSGSFFQVGTINLTTSWQTFTFSSISVASYPYWSYGNFIGISLGIPDSNYGATESGLYLWADNIQLT